VLESSSDSNSSDDEEETAATVGAAEPSVSSKEETDNDSPVAAADRKVDQSAATSKGEKPPMAIGESTKQEAVAGCRLFVRGVAQDTNIADLKAAFEAHGKVLDAYNSRKGFAFVTFSNASEATAAIGAFDKHVVCGCSVQVSLAKSKGGEAGSSGSKQCGQGGEVGGQLGGAGHEVHGAKLYVNNLSREISRKDLHEAFSLHGTVVDTFYKPERGFAFVTFASAAEANNVIVGMNGKEVCGRAIQCSLARPREKGGLGGGRRPASGRGGHGRQGGRGAGK